MNKDYINFTCEDFIEDALFREWVINPNIEQKKYWDEWILTHPEKKDDINAAKMILLGLKYQKIPNLDLKKDKIWNHIESTLDPKQTIFKLILRPTFIPWLVSIAASLFLIVYFFINSSSTIHVELVNAEVKSVTLPDLSIIDINAKSNVNFKDKNFIRNRIVNLTGEAFFNVVKGSSFKVLTPYGEIEVLGTSFNVYARDSILEVECFTGKVSVNYKGNYKKYILLPGDKINMFHDEVKITKKENSIQQIWKSGYFYFEETKLIRVLKELERQFDIKNIKTTVEIENKNYTGFFTKMDLQQALISICEPLQLKYQMVNDTLIIEQ